MASLNIFREPTKDEQQNMQVIGQAQPRDKFLEELAQKRIQAGKKGLPFAEAVAKDDWKDHHKMETQRLLRKYGKGYLTREAIKEYKHPEMDWDKYSDLKNFQVFKTKQMKDGDLTKRNNMPISRTLIVYKYKGYANTYTLMNSEQEAIMEAKKKHDELWNKPKPETVPEVRGSGKDKAKTK